MAISRSRPPPRRTRPASTVRPTSPRPTKATRKSWAFGVRQSSSRRRAWAKARFTTVAPWRDTKSSSPGGRSWGRAARQGVRGERSSPSHSWASWVMANQPRARMGSLRVRNTRGAKGVSAGWAPGGSVSGLPARQKPCQWLNVMGTVSFPVGDPLQLRQVVSQVGRGGQGGVVGHGQAPARQPRLLQSLP